MRSSNNTVVLAHMWHWVSVITGKFFHKHLSTSGLYSSDLQGNTSFCQLYRYIHKPRMIPRPYDILLKNTHAHTHTHSETVKQQFTFLQNFTFHGSVFPCSEKEYLSKHYFAGHWNISSHAWIIKIGAYTIAGWEALWKLLLLLNFKPKSSETLSMLWLLWSAAFPLKEWRFS